MIASGSSLPARIRRLAEADRAEEARGTMCEMAAASTSRDPHGRDHADSAGNGRSARDEADPRLYS